MKKLIFFNFLLFTVSVVFTSIIMGCRINSFQTSRLNFGSISTVHPIVKASTKTQYAGKSFGEVFLLLFDAIRNSGLITTPQNLNVISIIQIQSIIREVFIIPLFIVSCIIVLKTVHYRKLFADKNKSCWFYFGHVDIMLSLNDTRRKAKVIQNVLSIILFADLSLLFIMIVYLVL